LMFRLVKIQTTTSRGYESPCIFIEVVLLCHNPKDVS
jgi:hypothetical protein